MRAARVHRDDVAAMGTTNRPGVTQRGRSLVVGLGATGLATARYLHERGVGVLVVDSRAAPPGLQALRERVPQLPVVLESLDPKWLEGAERLVLSPGLPVDLPLVREARRRGVPVVSDIDVFAAAAAAPVLAVTGSNGKSTVATMLACVLRARGLTALAGGNLGPPALELLREPRPDVYVLEISSFQLETTSLLEPLAAAVLNVSADHLDRHESLEHYAALKARLLDAAERAIFNWDDPLVRAMGLRHVHGVPFSTRETLEKGFCVVVRDGRRWLARDLRPLMPADALRNAGTQGEANALATLALAEPLGGSEAAAAAALGAFEGLPHRCRLVAEHAGVRFIDDSKGTNVGATLAALTSLDGPIVLIAGGVGKGADFAPLARAGRGKLKAAVLIGEAGGELAAALTGVCPLVRAASMDEAVAVAKARAAAGDTVLLSPACASQDMFTDYRQRGEAFAAAVREHTR
jgi:UDP-N-acetylmuramoylalanine--D-glutamate ligase